MNQNKKLRVAIIGCGQIADAHLGEIQGAAQVLTVLASALGPVLLALGERSRGSISATFLLMAPVVAAVLASGGRVDGQSALANTLTATVPVSALRSRLGGPAELAGQQGRASHLGERTGRSPVRRDADMAS